MDRAAHKMAPRAPAEFVTALHSEHDRQLRRYLTRVLGSEADASDVAQETYLKLYRLSPPATVTRPCALLFKAAANLARSHIARRRHPVVALGPESDQVADPAPPPEAQIMAREALHRLAAIVEELPPRQRRVFVLHKFQGQTQAVIATELGLGLSTVEQHITRAVAYCRRRLAELDLNVGGTP